MSRVLIHALTAAGLLAIGGANAQAVVGQGAPAFKAMDTSGKTVQLGDFRGKYVVLEWVNPGCPYVRKHYSGNMQSTQKEAVGKGVVWLSVSSTAPDTYDYKAPADLAAWLKGQNAASTATLMDDSGTIGKAYGAKTTPHMYVIDPGGVLIYAGAIDDKPTSRVADIQGATNYVKQALGEAMAGKPVSVAATRAYGCAVKYSS